MSTEEKKYEFFLVSIQTEESLQLLASAIERIKNVIDSIISKTY